MIIIGCQWATKLFRNFSESSIAIWVSFKSKYKKKKKNEFQIHFHNLDLRPIQMTKMPQESSSRAAIKNGG